MSVESVQEELYDKAKLALGTLESQYLSSFAPYTRTRLSEISDPSLIVPLIETELGQESSPSVNKLESDIATIQARLNSSCGIVDGYEKPPTLSMPGEDPLEGWHGITIDPLWTGIQEAINARWLGPISEDAKAELRLLLVSNPSSAPDIETPARYRSSLFFNEMRSRVRGSGVMFDACIAELGRRQTYEYMDIARYCLVLLEYFYRDQYKKLLEIGMAFDEIQRQFSVKYGEIYAILTDVLVAEAKTEVGWFYEDYKTRLELWASAKDSNADNYLACVEAGASSIMKQAESDIQAALNNFDNSLKKLKAEFTFQSLDSKHELTLSGDKLAMFELQVNGLGNEVKAKITNAQNEYANTLGLLAAMGKGYADMLNSVAKRYIDISEQSQ
jgi:hypothetical protein